VRALFAFVFGFCVVPRCWDRRLYGRRTLLCSLHQIFAAAAEMADERDAEWFNELPELHIRDRVPIYPTPPGPGFSDQPAGLGIELADDLEAITVRPRAGLRFDQVQRDRKRQRKARRG